MFARACLTEESVEGVVTAADGHVGGHLTVGLDAMLQTVQLPACIADLHSGLTDVDGDTLTLRKKKEKCEAQTAVQSSTNTIKSTLERRGAGGGGWGGGKRR